MTNSSPSQVIGAQTSHQSINREKKTASNYNKPRYLCVRSRELCQPASLPVSQLVMENVNLEPNSEIIHLQPQSQKKKKGACESLRLILFVDWVVERKFDSISSLPPSPLMQLRIEPPGYETRLLMDDDGGGGIMMKETNESWLVRFALIVSSHQHRDRQESRKFPGKTKLTWSPMKSPSCNRLIDWIGLDWSWLDETGWDEMRWVCWS